MSWYEFVVSPGFKWLFFLLLSVIAVSAAVIAWIDIKYKRGGRRRVENSGKRFMRQYESYRAGIGVKRLP